MVSTRRPSRHARDDLGGATVQGVRNLWVQTCVQVRDPLPGRAPLQFVAFPCSSVPAHTVQRETKLRGRHLTIEPGQGRWENSAFHTQAKIAERERIVYGSLGARFSPTPSHTGRRTRRERGTSRAAALPRRRRKGSDVAAQLSPQLDTFDNPMT
jgi:hypothetical protein